MSCVTNRTVMPTVVAHLQDQVLQVRARLRVDRRERLVHQQDLRLVGERAGDRDALLHAARELPRVAVAEVRQADRRRAPRRARRARSALPIRRACSGSVDVARDRQPRAAASGCSPGTRAPAPAAARSTSLPVELDAAARRASSPDRHAAASSCRSRTGRRCRRTRRSRTSKEISRIASTPVSGVAVGLGKVRRRRASSWILPVRSVVPGEHPSLDEQEHDVQECSEEAQEDRSRPT